MGRHGYTDDCDDDAEGQWRQIRWRGAVTSALRGKPGQDFLRELLAALDALPLKELGYGTLVDKDGCACALGTVALARGLDCSAIEAPGDNADYLDDYAHRAKVARFVGIAEALAAEVMYANDNDLYESVDNTKEAREARFKRVRAWVVKCIRTRPEELLPLPSTEPDQ